MRRRIKVRVLRRNPHKKSRKRGRKHTRFGKVRAHKRRVNPMRKRSRKVSHKRRRVVNRRRNPSMNVKGLVNTTVKALIIGGGFIVGRQVVSLGSNGTMFGKSIFTPPAMLQGAARPFLGLLPIFVGVLAMKRLKGEKGKDFAMGLIAAGGVDILTVVVNKVSPGLLAGYVNVPHTRGYVNLPGNPRPGSGAMQSLRGIPIPVMHGDGSSFVKGGDGSSFS